MQSARKNGFTVVELIIVIVVIGVLATITMAMYGQAQRQARNTTRMSELRSWVDLFETYKARNGIYPRQNDTATSGACLGTGFPIGEGGVRRCRETSNNPGYSYLQSDSTALMAEFEKFAKMPPADKTPAGNGGWIVGPWAEFRPVGDGGGGPRINITTAIDSSDGSECLKAGFKTPYQDGGMAMCSYQINLPTT